MGNRSSAFTIIELVVSLAITSVIALFVFSFSINLAKLWRTTEGGVSTELDAQIALDTIVKDFESAIFQERGVPMFAASAISRTDSEVPDYTFSTRWDLATIANSGRPSDLHFDAINHHYGWAGLWVRFFTSSPSMNAVGYQIIRRPAFSDSNEPRYLLHRVVVRQDNTIAAGFGIASGNYSGTATSEVGAAAIEQPWVSSVFLEDVVDFGLRLYVFDPSIDASEDSPEGLRLIFPSSDDATLDSTEHEHLASTWMVTDDDYSVRYPDVVEVFIRVLDDVGSDLLYRAQEIEAGESYEEIVEKHSRVYRRMIRLPGREPQG